MTIDTEKEVTEVWTGADNIVSKSLAVMMGIKTRYDLCLDTTGPEVILSTPPIYDAYLSLHRRGVKIRMITEITKVNITEVSEMLKIAEIRHLDGLIGNFVVADQSDYACSPQADGMSLAKLIVSNVKPFVKQQQYFFELLWNKALPAEQRLKQIEERIEPERTEIWEGSEYITRKSLEILSAAKAGYDFCVDEKGPSIIVAYDAIKQAYIELKKRGGKLRLITEITDKNLAQCKEITDFLELRHMSGIKGNFGVVDKTIYGGTAQTTEGKTPPRYIYSNVKQFVEQQQYFFDMLWEKAVPADKRIKEIEEGIKPERTEVVTGAEKILRLTLEHGSQIKESVDSCTDSDSAVSFVRQAAMWNNLIAMHKRGIRMRLITEITKDNLPECKRLAELWELKHFAGVHGNFGISDGVEYRGAPEVISGGIPTNLICSSVRLFVRQQQYFFDTLWERAISADQRFKELEEGQEPEVTEIVSGWDNMLSRLNQLYARARERVDTCADSAAPAVMITNSFHQAGIDFINRGGEIRLVTEITGENLPYIKELMKTHEIRHLEGTKANFGVSEIDFTAPTSSGNHPQVVISNSRDVIKQHQYLFETLWAKAITAIERISELEKGVRPRTIQVIQDTHESIGRAITIMGAVQREYSVIFASARTFIIAAKTGVAELYGNMVRRGARVRVLVPSEKEDESVAESLLFYSNQFHDAAPGIELKISDANIKSRISFLVADDSEVITWELKDDMLEDPYEAGGIAIYSNIEALAISYATIFDNLWNVTNLTDTLRAANIRLESSQKAMNEFINIAAHELRTPIQPILGLAEILRGKNSELYKTANATDINNLASEKDPDINEIPEQKQLLEVIIRNAQRLGNLSEEILDVARIEGGRMTLRKENIDIYALVLKVVNDLKLPAASNNRKASSDHVLGMSHSNINNRVQVTSTLVADSGSNPIVVNADPTRISQVLSNLMVNALKSTEEGEISVKVERSNAIVSSENVRNSEVIVTVSDTGAGIDPEIIPRLFEKFVTKSDRGTGLGLYISKGIIEGHGGRIWGKNNENGRGASFTFTIPL